jgi:hypothetical protein
MRAARTALAAIALRLAEDQLIRQVIDRTIDRTTTYSA